MSFHILRDCFILRKIIRAPHIKTSLKLLCAGLRNKTWNERAKKPKSLWLHQLSSAGTHSSDQCFPCEWLERWGPGRSFGEYFIRKERPLCGLRGWWRGEYWSFSSPAKSRMNGSYNISGVIKCSLAAKNCITHLRINHSVLLLY